MYFGPEGLAAAHRALAVLAAGFLLRTYIVFHDCAHGSFLPSKRANIWLGTVVGLLVYSPFLSWRHDYAVYYATAGDLDRRGVGDVPTLTVAEYRARGVGWTAGLPAVPPPAGHVRAWTDLRAGPQAALPIPIGPPSHPAQRAATNVVLVVLVGLARWAIRWRE